MPGVPFALLVIFLGILCLAGGASRADALGQVVVQAASFVILVVTILFGRHFDFAGSRPIWIIVLAIAGVSVLQLIPLPPGLWLSLPGREVFAEAASASGQPQPWRPLSIVPGATLSALTSLVVPATAIVLMASLDEADRRWVPGAILSVIVVAALIGLLQFSGSGFDNPLINDNASDVSGTFANRNHFGLFLSFGLALAPVWAFLDGRSPEWRGPVAIGLILLFVLTLLASGSRVALLLGAAALGAGLFLIRESVRKLLRRYPRWLLPAITLAVVGLLAAAVAVSISAGRALSIDRAFGLQVGEDLRVRALPVVVDMVRLYFPVGSGIGAFDPVYRFHEPDQLLNQSYLNHAHNDYLEVALDAGIVGLLVLAGAMAWAGWASFQAWRAGSSAGHALPKLASVMLLLLSIASLFDYPARTPMMMAFAVVAGVWLNTGRPGRGVLYPS